ncbi:TRAP transporter large permease subunit [Chloroflexota bacterium]
MVFLILYDAYLFSDFLTLSKVPVTLINLLTGLQVSRYVVFGMIILIYILLGCFIEPIPMLIITVPVVLPVITDFGFDPVWFGVIAILMTEAALITPPVGLNVYVIGGLMKDVSLVSVFRGAVPFVLAIVAVVIILAAFPQVVLFLPGLIR